MKTNFFQTLTDLQVSGDWKITVALENESGLIVSVLLSNDKIGDDASKIIPPMIFKGTAVELDEGFFDALKTPAEETSKLFANMEQYVNQMEIAKQQSKMMEDEQNKEKTEKEGRKKKYEAQMKKVIELEEKEKWGEAIGAMPKAELFPEQAEEIKKRIEQLRTKHAQLALL